MSHATPRQFFLVAPMVYAAIGRLAGRNFKPKQLAELRDTQQRFRAATDGLSGTGPAYPALLAVAMIRDAAARGLPPEVARRAVVALLIGDRAALREGSSDEFNTERPHEALAMKTPAEVHTPSPRRFAGLPELTCPPHARAIVVSASGVIGLHGRGVVISSVVAGQKLGLREGETMFGSSASCTTPDQVRGKLISDASTWKQEPCKPLTPRSARGCHPCDRYRLLPMCPGRTVSKCRWASIVLSQAA